MYSAARAATVRAVSACQLWVMDRAVYVTLKQRHQRQMIEDKRRAVSQVPMLAVLSQVAPRAHHSSCIRTDAFCCLTHPSRCKLQHAWLHAKCPPLCLLGLYCIAFDRQA